MSLGSQEQARAIGASQAASLASYGSFVHGGVNARYVRGPREAGWTNPTSPATFRFIGERALQVTRQGISWRVK